MLSWYWMKGSPLRYFCRSLSHETGKSVIILPKPESTNQKEHMHMNLLLALTKDIPIGIRLQVVPAALFMLQHNRQTLGGLREHG